MKQFLLFLYAHYEAAGGMDDLIGDFYTIEEAKKHLNDLILTKESDGWLGYMEGKSANIYDIINKKEVFNT